MNKQIIDTIKQYEKSGDFNYAPVTGEMISSAEMALGIKLPEQYVEYIKMFGHGGIGGIEIMGVGLTGRMIFVDTTLEYRDENLPDNLVVIENVDDYLTCIDCNNGKIVSWDFTGYVKEDYECFDDYLIAQMKEAIDNM
ncbi:MAG: SMI1/KNR4 family protein [Lachnospiraceae bacterium]|nr:SMI1/KNR4 family protein [Lachnospiraceae bacterium]